MVGVAVAADGSPLISDDAQKLIWRVSFAPEYLLRTRSGRTLDARAYLDRWTLDHDDQMRMLRLFLTTRVVKFARREPRPDKMALFEVQR